MRNRILHKFLITYIVLIFIAIIILDFLVSIKLKDYYEEKITDKLKSTSYLTVKILQEKGVIEQNGFILKLAQEVSKDIGARVTIVNKEGYVLGDSEENPGEMENHLNRPEIQDAVKKGFGESTRFSDTLGFNMKYIAVPITINGRTEGIVRISLPLTEIESQLRIIYRVVLVSGIVAIMLALVVGFFLSRGITWPIAQMTEIAERISKGDFSKKVSVRSRDELGALAKSLNKMADDLQSKIENLDKLNTVRKDFVANVSHELRTPLTSIKGFIETLEDGALHDKANAIKFIQIIKKHTERINSIIDDLLSLSELELGKDRIKKEEFDLKASLNEILLGFQHILSSKKHSLQTDIKGDDFRIKADKYKIEQILVNLLDNAIKYTQNSGKITVSMLKQGKSITISVADSGIGIPKEHLDRIFERFYRVDKARSRQLGGTGLGLAIVKHIVLLHDGKINIESEVQKGTKITISLPLV